MFVFFACEQFQSLNLNCLKIDISIFLTHFDDLILPGLFLQWVPPPLFRVFVEEIFQKFDQLIVVGRSERPNPFGRSESSSSPILWNSGSMARLWQLRHFRVTWNHEIPVGSGGPESLISNKAGWKNQYLPKGADETIRKSELTPKMPLEGPDRFSRFVNYILKNWMMIRLSANPRWRIWFGDGLSLESSKVSA